MRIAFLIRSLDAGGAQRQVTMLARGLRQRGDNVTVIVFYGGNTPLASQLVDCGVRLVTLDKKSRWDVLGFLYRLCSHLRAEIPDVLHGYLVDSNILVTLLSPMLPGTATVWGIRASNMDLSHYDWLARFTFKFSCWLSRFPDLIISNSEAGRRHHIASGFRPTKMEVVSNGIDTAYFRAHPAAGKRLRAEWNVSDTTPLIGMVARLDPMKDHFTFLRAAALLVQELPDARFVCVGDGPAEYRQHLLRFSDNLGLSSHVLWTGNRTDLPDLYSALNLATLTSSSGEGFPNVIAEAMACGVPVVATDVGDVLTILGPLGTTVATGNPTLLKAAWITALRTGRTSSNELRDRVVRKFSANTLIEMSRNLLIPIVRSV